MTSPSRWMPLQQALRLLLQYSDECTAKISLVERMGENTLKACAVHWHESMPPYAYKDRPQPLDLETDRTLVPSDFWQRSHAIFRELAPLHNVPGTTADWSLGAFGTTIGVTGGDMPRLSDSWGFQRRDRGRNWDWLRNAIGIFVDADEIQKIVRAYNAKNLDSAGSPLKVKTNRGYLLVDAPLVEEGVAMLGDGRAKSALNAATKLASRAEGNSEPAKIERLRKQIGEKFRDLRRR